MRVLVIGGRGFLGGHLVDELRGAGHQAIVADREEGDITNESEMLSLFQATKPDVAVHSAAVVGRPNGEVDRQKTVLVNAYGTINVARAAALHGARLVYISTSEIFGDRAEEIATEDGPRSLPYNLYGLSKRWGEEGARLYSTNELKIIRPSMPYGPGVVPGWNRAAIINMLWQAANRMRIPVHRGAKRSWCWVGDAIRAMRLVIEHGAPGPYNVGRDDAEVTMLEVAQIACELAGAPESLIDQVDPPSDQTVVKRLATDKIRALGWEPLVGLKQGMLVTYEWVKQFDADGVARDRHPESTPAS